jgi:hypothetical protein
VSSFYFSNPADKIARSRGAELALAAVKHYRMRGRYPSEIDGLVPRYIDRIPADPYDDTGTMAMADEGGDLIFHSPAHESLKGERLGFRLRKQ